MKRLLHIIYLIALRSYWKGQTHCGSDLGIECINHCQHYDICKLAKEFDERIIELK